MLRIAKVVAVHPEAHAVDLVFVDNNTRMNGAKVMASSGGTQSGVVDIPMPTAPDKPYDLQRTNKSDVYAVTSSMGGIAVVLGFLLPEGGQMTFLQPGRRISRHGSDVYTSLDADGNLEVYHPSGTFLRIGVSPDHEDLTGEDFNKSWAIDKNTDKEVHLNIVVANGGAVKARLHIAPTGAITVTGASIDATTTGATKFKASAFEFDGPATFKSPTTFNENVQVNKTLTATTDVVGGGKSVKGHTHGGVQTGGGVSGPPS